MKKSLCTVLFVNCLIFTAWAQRIGFKYSDKLKFVNSTNDTIPYPFTGGFIAPQFNSIDLNLDGKKDLLVFDRSGYLIQPYIFTGNTGEFKYQYAPEYRNKLPKLLNWVRTFDYNNDGKMDIITNADPDAPAPPGVFVQNNHVRIFKNVSTATEFKLQLLTVQLKCIYYFVDTSALSITNSDLPDVADIDQDGDMDIVAMSSLGAYIELYKNYQVEKGLPVDSFLYHNVDRCWGSVQITDRVKLGVSCGKTYFKANAHFGTTTTLFDYDGDGDMDLYTGDILNDYLYFIKNGKKELSWKYGAFSADTLIAYDSLVPNAGNPLRFFPSGLAAYFVDLNNDGKKDMVVAPNTGDASKNKNNIWLYQNTGSATLAAFTFVKNNFLQEQSVDLGKRFTPALLDYDHDGKMDLIAATGGDWQYTQNKRDHLVLFRNVGSSSYPVFKMIDTNYLSIDTLNLTNVRLAIGDINRDNKPDMILGLANGTLVFLQNNSTGTGAQTFSAPVRNFKNITAGLLASPAIFDMNMDGLGDLLIGTDLGNIQYYRNKGGTQPGSFNFSSTPEADTLGKILSKERPNAYYGYAAPAVFNYKNDGIIEIATGSFEGTVRVFRMDAGLKTKFQEMDSVLMNAGDTVYNKKPLGAVIKSVPLIANFDEDSIPDLLVGLDNGGILYFKGFDRGILPPVLIGHDTAGMIQAPNNMIELHNSGVKFYPNPVKNTLTIERSENSPEEDINIQIVNILGELIHVTLLDKSDKSKSIEVSDLKPGIYFIKTRSAISDLEVFRIIKY